MQKNFDKETIVIKKVIILGWDDSSHLKLRGVDVFKSIFPHLFKIPYDQKSKQIFSDAALEKRQLEFFNYFSDIDVFKYLRPKKQEALFKKFKRIYSAMNNIFEIIKWDLQNKELPEHLDRNTLKSLFYYAQKID